MTSAVENSLPVLCAVPENPEPAGGRCGYLMTSDKVRLRYAIWPKSDGPDKGTIVLVQGRTEFIEKYFETIEDFRRRGFSVATFDWRGQGGSSRLINDGELGYVDRFEDYVTDLMSFHNQLVLPDCQPPFYLVGHSMGGLVALMTIIRDRLMYDRVFLSAPMLAIPGLPLSVTANAVLGETLGFLGLGKLPVAKRSGSVPAEKSFPGNPLTSDFERYMRTPLTYAARPDLVVSAPTAQWSGAAFRAMSRAAADDFPERISVPVLMLAAARDAVVSTPAIEQLGLRMRTGRHAVIARARHELFMENDIIRAQVLAAFDAFITEKTDI